MPSTAKPAKPGTKHGSKASVTYEIAHNKPDKNGNKYPPKDKAYIVVSEKASSNKELTKLFLDKVLLPAAGVKKTLTSYNFNDRVGVLCDNFTSHSLDEVRSFTNLTGSFFPCVESPTYK